MVSPLDNDYPEVEEFDDDEWKLLFMLLAENRGHLDLAVGLTPRGKYLLGSVQRKLGIRVVGVDTPLGDEPLECGCDNRCGPDCLCKPNHRCQACGERKLYVRPEV